MANQLSYRKICALHGMKVAGVSNKIEVIFGPDALIQPSGFPAVIRNTKVDPIPSKGVDFVAEHAAKMKAAKEDARREKQARLLLEQEKAKAQEEADNDASGEQSRALRRNSMMANVSRQVTQDLATGKNRVLTKQQCEDIARVRFHMVMHGYDDARRFFIARMDDDESGVITKKEFVTTMADIGVDRRDGEACFRSMCHGGRNNMTIIEAVLAVEHADVKARAATMMLSEEQLSVLVQLREVFKSEFDSEDVAQAFAKMDEDGSNELDYKEWIAAMSKIVTQLIQGA